MLLSQLLKEGTKHLSGVDEAVLKNIEAVKELSKITRTSLGPNGMNKMVINKLGKLVVTNDAATILKELEVIHPAAKLCVMASEQQQQELGDATNLVMVLCGEFLAQAEILLKMGLHTSDIIRGYEKAQEKVGEFLRGSATKTIKDLTSKEEVALGLRSSISAKQHGFEDVFAPLVAQACLMVLPKEHKQFNVDNVRVAKILGGGITDACVIKGVVVTRDSEGTIKQASVAKVAVYSQGFDTEKTDTKGKVYIEKSSELEEYARTEETAMEQKIKSIRDAGIDVVISGGNISELAMHYLEKYQMMVIKSQSKFELRRICQATNALPIMRMGAPTPEEIGHVFSCTVEEVGGTRVTIIRQEEGKSGVSTIIARAATNNILDDIERSIEDATNVFKAMTNDPTFVPGAGAAEIELSRQIKALGDRTPGQDQYAIKKYAEAFEIVPRILAENAGLDATNVISNLYATHEKGQTAFGVDVMMVSGVTDAITNGILDHLHIKQRAIELATNAVITVLSISQIIMAKPSGVPVPGSRSGTGTMGSMDQEEDL